MITIEVQYKVKIFLKGISWLDSIEFYLLHNDWVLHDNVIDFYFYDDIGDFKIYTIRREFIKYLHFHSYKENFKPVALDDYLSKARQLIDLI